MKHVKITDANGQTRGKTQWGEGVTHEAEYEGNTLCSNQVLHGYVNAHVAVFFNPIHGGYAPTTMRLWEAEGEVVADDGTKLGFKRQTTIREIAIPNMTLEQRVKIAIRIALNVYNEPKYVKWANKWLDNEDRTYAAAADAADAANAATYAAANAATATYAAIAAADIAAADAATATAYAANAATAYAAANAATYAAADAAIAAYTSVIAIIDEVMMEEA